MNGQQPETEHGTDQPTGGTGQPETIQPAADRDAPPSQIPHPWYPRLTRRHTIAFRYGTIKPRRR